MLCSWCDLAKNISQQKNCLCETTLYHLYNYVIYFAYLSGPLLYIMPEVTAVQPWSIPWDKLSVYKCNLRQFFILISPWSSIFFCISENINLQSALHSSDHPLSILIVPQAANRTHHSLPRGHKVPPPAHFLESSSYPSLPQVNQSHAKQAISGIL